MITQELINYVTAQVSSGVTREKITADLLGQGGWTMEQINEAFTRVWEQTVPVPNQHDKDDGLTNRYWQKLIPDANKRTWKALKILGAVDLVILVFLFFIDIDTVIFLLPFLAYMVVGVIIHAGFSHLENSVFRPHFLASDSKIDSWILTINGLRHSALVLNLVPFIQVIGLMIVTLAGIPYLIIYSILIWRRYKV